MSELLELYESQQQGGEDGGDGGLVVIDVRTLGEIAATGKLSPSARTLPLDVVMERDAFGLDDDDFFEATGFPKPDPDATLVFTCAAGVRSVYACQFAAKNGYTNLVNYVGGSNEWFSS